MLSTYKRVFWLSVVMSLFAFAPFDVTGFSTDVWTRLTRIREWANAGFPFQEQLMMTQNYPFGFEMHWTRPLDFIGYALAWPFIPNWGLDKALEIMACFTPVLVFMIGLRGFYYGFKGYVSPKLTFFGFWFFFYSIGYAWGQASIGYFDHHIFHFTILVWCIALIARSFLVHRKTTLMIAAGLLTALGTWITPEFFINTYLLITPFILYWFFRNDSLKPAIIYLTTYTVALGAVLLFDHPISGFTTLDLYRPSLMHVILGATNVILLSLLSIPLFRKNIVRRFIYALLFSLTIGLVLLFQFDSVLLAPMVDPIQYHFWTKKVTEMEPLYKNWSGMVLYSLAPLILASGLLLWAIDHPKHKIIPLLLIGMAGTFFYVPIMISHVRVGISVQSFFIFLSPLYLSIAFHIPPHTFKKELLFVIFCCIFSGIAIKGDLFIHRFKKWGVQHYLTQYRNDNTIQIPDMLKKPFEELLKEKEEDKNNVESNNTTNTPNHPEDDNYACSPSKTVLDYVNADKGTAAILTPIFEAPQLLWKTKRPVLGGPYDRNMEGLTDLFAIELDRPPYHTAKKLIQKHQVELIYMTHPNCQSFLFWDSEKKALKSDLDNTFWYATYFQTKDAPKWLKLAYHNHKTHIKIFQLIPDKK